jgi:hypothetical protein
MRDHQQDSDKAVVGVSGKCLRIADAIVSEEYVEWRSELIQLRWIVTSAE